MFRFFFTARFVRFLLFGGSAALVNLVVGRAIYSDSASLLPYWLAVTIAASAGMVVNFGLNYAYNFTQRRRGAFLEFRTFVIVASVGVALTALLAALALRVLLWASVPEFKIGPLAVTPEFLSHVFAVGAVTFYSYAAHSAFSFRQGLRAGVRQALGRGGGGR